MWVLGEWRRDFNQTLIQDRNEGVKKRLMMTMGRESGVGRRGLEWDETGVEWGKKCKRMERRERRRRGNIRVRRKDTE